VWSVAATHPALSCAGQAMCRIWASRAAVSGSGSAQDAASFLMSVVIPGHRASNRASRAACSPRSSSSALSSCPALPSGSSVGDGVCSSWSSCSADRLRPAGLRRVGRVVAVYLLSAPGGVMCPGAGSRVSRCAGRCWRGIRAVVPGCRRLPRGCARRMWPSAGNALFRQ
jgi:hypothetical protein